MWADAESSEAKAIPGGAVSPPTPTNQTQKPAKRGLFNARRPGGWQAKPR